MSGEPEITIIGNLTSDPELRWTSNEVPLASFTVASTPSSYNRQSGQWEDGTTLFIRCTAWRDLAQNLSESLSKGMRVIVKGRLTQRDWESKDGQRRSSVEIQVDEVGPSLRYAQAQVTRMGRGGNGSAGNQGGNFGSNQGNFQQGGGSFGGFNQGGGNFGGQGVNQGSGGFGGPQNGSADDPWATGGADEGGSSFDQNPPF